MIWNIIDERDRKYRWKRIHAIVEAVEHDNSCQDTDEAPTDNGADYVTFEERKNISVQEAVKWADGLRGRVTLFLRDMPAARRG